MNTFILKIGICAKTETTELSVEQFKLLVRNDGKPKNESVHSLQIGKYVQLKFGKQT
jgi:hypothetical protein